MRPERFRAWLGGLAPLLLTGCAAFGSLMSPYPETFGCKNKDHGVCIHPEQAYEDAVANRASISDPAVTQDKRLLKPKRTQTGMDRHARGAISAGAFAGYRASVYTRLQGLIDQPVTPMLKSPRTIRTLILPYAERERPDRLYMPRYVFSILEAPEWVIGDYLVEPVAPVPQTPILGQTRESPLDTPAQERRP